MKISILLLILLFFLTGCDYFDNHLRKSSKITAGDSETIPFGLVDWCNKLDKQQFYNEPECLWYCRVYSKDTFLKNVLKNNSKARIESCTLN